MTDKKKNGLVIISDAPCGAVSEKLRMTVGLTLDDGSSIKLLLIDDGVYTGLGLDHERIGLKDINQPFEMFDVLKVEVFAHKPSVDERDLVLSKFTIKEADDDSVSTLLQEADFTIA